ncbi:hypothetical protein [Nonomuraea sp. NEAU-A123]|uniref:hypothetical protein n=1 Tax=Nonomuraea sp. NEAU-A123 TaxID=2839649 RepID=UPI001BE4A267|nr:hypothetical protein [Nonomuraea sp. NEAU-A123]
MSSTASANPRDLADRMAGLLRHTQPVSAEPEQHLELVAPVIAVAARTGRQQP